MRTVRNRFFSLPATVSTVVAFSISASIHFHFDFRPFCVRRHNKIFIYFTEGSIIACQHYRLASCVCDIGAACPCVLYICRITTVSMRLSFRFIVIFDLISFCLHSIEKCIHFYFGRNIFLSAAHAYRTI